MKQGYSQLQLDLASKVKIRNALLKAAEGTEQEKDEKVQQLINIPYGELHCTLMYDKRDPDLNPNPTGKVYKAKITGIERLGTPGGKHYALVLLLESETVQERFTQLKELGYEHSWDELKLHISLHYGADVNVLYPVLQSAYEKKLLPKVVTLGMEAWNECN